jgi:hypothetical protein
LRLCNISKNRRRYTNELKDIALSVKYHSPKAYRFLRKFLHLPSERTLSEYQKQFPIYPGLNETVLKQLKTSLGGLDKKDRLVNVLFDEINLSEEIHYDNHLDEFKGLADNGKTRTDENAKSALVAMITWINKPWKQVIGYWFLSKNDNSNLTHRIMEETIEKLFKCDVIVKSLVCDQGPRNVGMFKKHKMSTEKPFFKISGYVENIYFIYDPPHLLKSVRNNLFQKQLRYGNGYARWSVIETIYNVSKVRPLNLIPKITEKHLFNISNGDKMSVSLAAQVFSDSMYTAYLVYTTIESNLFPADDTTGQLVIDMDKLFDCLNSRLERKTIDKKLNYAISKDSDHHQFLNDMINKLDACYFIPNKATDKKRPPCLQGLNITINSILQLSEELREKYGIPLLKTRRFNQDPLENLFATIRQQHGCSVNPSPKQFETGLRHIFITQLSKISNVTNCEMDENKIFVTLRAGFSIDD